MNARKAAKKRSVNPAALTAEELAGLISAASKTKVKTARVQADIDAGAPTRPDGRINLIHYAAWLCRRK